MNKILIIGSCSVDFTTYALRLPKPGETIHGTKFVTSFGGKGGNQCVAAAKLGGNTSIICRVGDDQWGTQYLENLKQAGVDTRHVFITPNVATGIAQISVSEAGENHIVIVPGANGHLSSVDVNYCEETIKQADVLVGQLETPFETTLEAFKLNSGIKILNAAPARKNIHQILPYCSILCVNESEASLLTGMDVNLMNSTKAIEKLLATGCETVIITLGSQGAVYSSRNQQNCIHVLCEQVTPIDTTGAGDAFVGALATFLMAHRNYPLHQIIGAACQIATFSVTREGTQTSYSTNSDIFNKVYEHIILDQDI